MNCFEIVDLSKDAPSFVKYWSDHVTHPEFARMQVERFSLEPGYKLQPRLLRLSYHKHTNAKVKKYSYLVKTDAGLTELELLFVKIPGIGWRLGAIFY